MPIYIQIYESSNLVRQPQCTAGHKYGELEKTQLYKKINLLSSNLHIAGYEVVFMWVPGHNGISGNEIADTLAKLASSSIPQTDMPAHQKIVHSSLNPSHINPLIADHCLKVWNNEYVNNPNGSTYKTYFPQITQDYRTQKQRSISLFDQDRTLQVKQSCFFFWTPPHWNVRALPCTGNSFTFSHHMPSVPTTATDTPKGNERTRSPVSYVHLQ